MSDSIQLNFATYICNKIYPKHPDVYKVSVGQSPYIRSWEIPWNSWEKAGEKLGIFPRNLLRFLGFYVNEEARKVSNFSQELSLDKIPVFPEAGKMIVTENIHPPFLGILRKPGSRKLEIGPPFSWESWDYLESREESTKIFQENWDYSGSLEKFTIYSWKSLEKSTPFPGSIRISLKQ